MDEPPGRAWGVSAAGLETRFLQTTCDPKELLSPVRFFFYHRHAFALSAIRATLTVWCTEGGVVGPRERAGDHVHEVRALGFALMNAGIRANMNEESTLKKLWNIAKRNKTNKTRPDPRFLPGQFLYREICSLTLLVRKDSCLTLLVRKDSSTLCHQKVSNSLLF